MIIDITENKMLYKTFAQIGFTGDDNKRIFVDLELDELKELEEQIKIFTQFKEG